MMVSSPLQQNQPFIVPQEMTPGSGTKHLPLEQRFPHGTQFFLPQNHGGVTTYMVVSSRDTMSPSVQSPSTVVAASGEILKSPPAAGVSQILANVTKTNLVSDIDNPNKLSKSHTNTVWVNRDQLNNKSQLDPMRRPIVQTNDKGHQIHVHKVHHGNARVKYVEFKPVKDGNTTVQSPQQQQIHKQHQQQQHGGYNQYYHNQQPSHNRLSVQTQQQQQQQQQQQHSALSPLHSPPALQPPPSIAPRSRANAMNSPPSLVPSPAVRPRFEYQQQQQQQQQQKQHQQQQQQQQQHHMRNYANKAAPSFSMVQIPVSSRMPFVQKYQPSSNAGNNNGSGGKTTVLQAFRSIPENVGKTFHHTGIIFHFTLLKAVRLILRIFF